MGWSPTGRSTARLALPCKGNGTSWACGWGPAVRERSTGSRSSPGIKNRGTKDVCIVVSDGLTGMTEAITATWPLAIHQTCVIHPLRKVVPVRRAQGLAGDRCGSSTGVLGLDARPRHEPCWRRTPVKWAAKYPAIIRLWETGVGASSLRSAKFDVEIRTVIYTTNAIESIHARFRRAGACTWSLPQRDCGLDVRLPDRQKPGPHRDRKAAMDEPMQSNH